MVSICSGWLRSPIWHGLYMLRVAQIPNIAWSIYAQCSPGTQYDMIHICSKLLRHPIWHGLYLLKVVQVPNMAIYLLKVAQVHNMTWCLNALSCWGTQYGMVSICSRFFRYPIWHSLYLLKVAQIPNMA